MSDLVNERKSPSGSAFRELAGSSSPSMRTAALARLAAASTAGAAGDGPFSSDQLHQLLLAQQRAHYHEHIGATDDGGGGLHHHLGLSPQVATLLAHQRLKLLQEQAAAAAVAGGGNGGGGNGAPHGSSSSDPTGGLAHLLLQQRQSELLLAEQIRQHHGRLLASQLALQPSMVGDALALGGGASATGGLPNGSRPGVPRSSSVESSSSAARAAAAEGASGRPSLGGAESPAHAPRDEAGDGPNHDDNNKEPDDSLDTFPFKLFRMLEEAESGGGKDIVSFNDKGRCFLIHKPKEFVAEIMPKYFTTTRMSSFQRQLNLYGFRRIPEGPDKGGYIHENFIRGQKNLCRKIKRKKPSTKAPPPGLMYVNPSSLSGGMMENNASSALSVRQILADGQRSSDQVTAAHQLAQLGNLGGLVGMYGVGNSTLSTALLLEQQHQQQQLRLRLHQQQQQADMMQQLLLRHQQERDLAQFMQRHQQDAQQQPPPPPPQGASDANVLGAQQAAGPR